MPSLFIIVSYSIVLTRNERETALSTKWIKEAETFHSHFLRCSFHSSYTLDCSLDLLCTTDVYQRDFFWKWCNLYNGFETYLC